MSVLYYAYIMPKIIEIYRYGHNLSATSEGAIHFQSFIKRQTSSTSSDNERLNVITALIWDFFSNGDFPSRICMSTFSGQLYFWRNYFTLLQSNYFKHNIYFVGAAISSELLLFFEELHFSAQSSLRSSYFFKIATFSEQNFHRAASPWQ